MAINMRKAAVVAAAAAMSAVIGAFGATPAQAATSGRCYSNPSATCYPSMSTTWTPWSSPTSKGLQMWSISRGTRVDMQCWTTGATQLNTGKWFRVRSLAYPFTSGYVPANAVASQIVVGHC